MAIVDCTLSSADLGAQIDRYARLGAMASGIEQDGLQLQVVFGPTLDVELLEQTIAVERGCCRFFTVDYDAAQRRLSVVVDDPARVGALDAIGGALTGRPPAPPEP